MVLATSQWAENANCQRQEIVADLLQPAIEKVFYVCCQSFPVQNVERKRFLIFAQVHSHVRTVQLARWPAVSCRLGKKTSSQHSNSFENICDAFWKNFPASHSFNFESPGEKPQNDKSYRIDAYDLRWHNLSDSRRKDGVYFVPMMQFIYELASEQMWYSPLSWRMKYACREFSFGMLTQQLVLFDACTPSSRYAFKGISAAVMHLVSSVNTH